MKILLINHYAGSLEMGMEYRPYYMGREWAKSGHDVTIICASFAHVRKEQPIVKKDFQEEENAGIKYVYLKTPKYEGNGIGRILNMFVFVFKLIFNASKISRKYKPDIVIASSTYPMDNYPARRIAKRSNAKYVYEVHDLWPLSPMELGGLSKNHPFIRIVQAAENFAYKNVDLLISMLPKTLPYMMEHGLDAKKWHYIPNGVVVDEWDENINPSTTPFQKIDDLKKQGYKLIAYTGSMGIANALDNLISAADLLKAEKYHFIIVGGGPEKERLKKKVVGNKLTNVSILDPVPKTSLPFLLDFFDILYIGLQRQPLFRFGISPNKMLDYMMAGKPVIQAIDAGNDMVAEAGCGISIEPENPEELAKAIKTIFAFTEDERKRLGENGKAFVMKNHDYKKLAKAMLGIFEQKN